MSYVNAFLVLSRLGIKQVTISQDGMNELQRYFNQRYGPDDRIAQPSKSIKICGIKVKLRKPRFYKKKYKADLEFIDHYNKLTKEQINQMILDSKLNLDKKFLSTPSSCLLGF